MTVNGVDNNKLEKYGQDFMNVISKFEADADSKPTTESKKYDVAEIRANGFKSAYEPWTENEVAKLRFEYELDISIKEIAKNHKRTTTAVKSRLEKEKLI